MSYRVKLKKNQIYQISFDGVESDAELSVEDCKLTMTVSASANNLTHVASRRTVSSNYSCVGCLLVSSKLINPLKNYKNKPLHD